MTERACRSVGDLLALLSRSMSSTYWNRVTKKADPLLSLKTLRFTDKLENCHYYQSPVVPYAARNKVVESESVVTCHKVSTLLSITFLVICHF